jgi:hypothetical protein
MRGLHFAVDACFGRHDQRTGLIGQRGDVAADHSVDAQSAAEDHVAFDARRRADEAVDPVLRLARFVEHFSSPCSFKG